MSKGQDGRSLFKRILDAPAWAWAAFGGVMAWVVVLVGHVDPDLLRRAFAWALVTAGGAGVALFVRAMLR